MTESIERPAGATSTSATDHSSAAAPDRHISGVEIQLRDVVKKYPGQKSAAVESLSLTVPAGEVVMFIGPSGCGKTTSLKMINRLIEPTSGTITIGGEDVRGRDADELRRTIGYVIQGGSLFPHLTVADNIAVVPKLLKWSKQRTADRVEELLDLVGLEPGRYRDRYPRELSGGQQQRVGVARGLAADPPVVLMDEPFGAVDPITRQRLQDEMLGIQRELGKTIVCVTHDIDEAIKLGDRILILSEGAHVEQYDTPENVLAAPANDFVADFVGAGSTLKQLSLSRVDELQMLPWTTARVGDDAAEAVRRAEAAGHDCIVVLDARNRPIAWPWLRNLRRGGSIDIARRDELITLDQRATLNDALDTMLSSSHAGAIVTDSRDTYVGVVDFESVTTHIRSQEASAKEAQQARADGAVS
ncbi:ABC transporter ATP-binding protein [Nocardioides sp. ChNu-153]|uniref:ABC transporter ATP-binding protein n=1 Tax=unclassified Nocardioides TaxID=2615069 RepID=UPI002406C454|nr:MULTISPECIES: ABC transporter ATP-binding protein [unclassified Nocardioides]MDF9715663.1 ABC transporter ATP-binding protein [Nocardioides sp. ChNu-99]MDN7121647.1 ABC transporter ATP-binding protein [Nocardioides sp. ChNu-153]